MPKGPKGEKRPGDVIGAAIRVAQIATGEMYDENEDDGNNDEYIYVIMRRCELARA